MSRPLPYIRTNSPRHHLLRFLLHSLIHLQANAACLENSLAASICKHMKKQNYNKIYDESTLPLITRAKYTLHLIDGKCVPSYIMSWTTHTSKQSVSSLHLVKYVTITAVTMKTWYGNVHNFHFHIQVSMFIMECMV